MRFLRMMVVAAAYLLVSLFVLGLGQALAGILILPPLFHTLLVGLLALGFVVTLAAAWVYRPPPS